MSFTSALVRNWVQPELFSEELHVLHPQIKIYLISLKKFKSAKCHNLEGCEISLHI